MTKRATRLLEAQGLYDYAVGLLAGRAHSTGEMREKLRRKAAEPDDVEGVLGRLKDHGYLDDRKFADSYAAARLENQGMGARRVLRDLRARRVAPAVAESSVSDVYSKVDEDALIEEYIRRKYRGRGELLQDEKDLAAAWRRLLRAGFAPGNVIRVLKKFARNPDLLDSFEPPQDEGPDQ